MSRGRLIGVLGLDLTTIPARDRRAVIWSYEGLPAGTKVTFRLGATVGPCGDTHREGFPPRGENHAAYEGVQQLLDHGLNVELEGTPELLADWQRAVDNEW
ncbi:MAG TPA: hypothetical protein VMF51_08440 [Nocardioides sp.]|uniref:hypothetical protein n=1 Tax=Nocardioides sp. TaxID=35761 RepID=UPI002B6CE4F8|nr:hypothetical protein [Nocardioides sp.]HTW15144.1 hypothetical protein [Nocardioides sp.]